MIHLPICDNLKTIYMFVFISMLVNLKIDFNVGKTILLYCSYPLARHSPLYPRYVNIDPPLATRSCDR